MERRSEQANIRLSPVELATLASKADAVNTTVTEFIRAAALNKRTPVRQTNAPDFATRDELRRIGVNLNQIARVLNAGGTVDTSEISGLCAKLDTLFDQWLSNDSQSCPTRPQF